MAANCRNKFDVFLWICKNIDSSTTENHINGCKKLVHQYFKIYQDLALFHELYKQLEIKIKNLNNTTK